MGVSNLTTALAIAFWVPLAAFPGADFQRGMVYSSWDGSYPNREAWTAHLDHFEALGVSWIQVLTFAHQPDVDAPDIRLMPERRWPRAFIDEARKRGFRVLLKPHVWSREFYDGSKRWRGSIKMADEAAWRAWFDAYEPFIVREARLAQAAGVEMLSVGLEYVEASKRGADWRRVVRAVRAVYDGTLTYAADGNHELGHIDFWDALDVVGVNVYFKLDASPSPSLLTLQFGWLPWLLKMQAVALRSGRPVVFTEAGYPSVEGAAAAPWQWPSGNETVDLALQARAYDALMWSCTSMSWCRGVYWWKWYERPEGHSHAHDYSPRNKPAEAVIRHWFRETLGKPN